MTENFRARLIYPNPFVPVGMEFELPQPGFVTLRLLDQKGEEVETIIGHKEFDIGKQLIPFDIVKFTNGNHFIQMVVEMNEEKIVETKRI